MNKNTYHIITIGCQMNKSDSERIAGYLEERGYSSSDKPELANLIVINTCGVRQSAEDRAYGLVNRIKKENSRAKIVLAGCLSEREDVKGRLKEKINAWLPIKELAGLEKKLSAANDRGAKEKNYLEVNPKYKSKVSAFVPIGNGCNNFCSYCVVPYARGREVYRPVEDILREVRSLVSRGYKEINLIAQNVNSYVFSAPPKDPVNFSDLLKMVNRLEGDFWIRFSTSHPKDMDNGLIRTVAECDKVCEHIHLPVQSGDNEILEAMNRNYTVEHYQSLIKRIRQAIPNAAITTDIIVGFPGETREQFNNTVQLFKKIKFDMAYISQYSPRPGTTAASLEDDVSSEEKKRREEELMQILRKFALENNKRYIGQEIKVLVKGKNKKGEWYGQARAGKNVKLGVRKLEEGFLKVKIIKAKDFKLTGVLKYILINMSKNEERLTAKKKYCHNRHHG